MKWECNLESGEIVKEVDDNKFNLSWEQGGVKSFKITNGKEFYSINLATGEFNLNGKKEISKNYKGGSLVYFKRNKVLIKNGIPGEHKITYFIGSKKGDKEKLLNVSPKNNKVEFANR